MRRALPFQKPHAVIVSALTALVARVTTPCDELTWLDKVGASCKQLIDNLETRAAELSKEKRMMQLASAKLGKGQQAAAYKLLSFLAASRLASP
ncbi:hypothetical protein DPX39_000073200 [Trypanosoma brucei equiperdum]|uniref:Uncharacterized protein n=1 Tax=Trypanosoma brucei equiperdum TaxID=630700 RepID=A0A3L6KQ54_9TRYP|nr:hypothetical protein DPX39_000073200 [Trypanosoma brucei equiperdum]